MAHFVKLKNFKMKKILCLLLLSFVALGLQAQHDDLPDDATILATDVVYWVGNGNGQAIASGNTTVTAHA